MLYNTKKWEEEGESRKKVKDGAEVNSQESRASSGWDGVRHDESMRNK